MIPQRGFTLLIAVILASVALSIGLSLLDIVYRQLILASSMKQSQTSFYAADSALECALYGDQKIGIFAYTSSPPGSVSVTCVGPTEPIPVTLIVSQPDAQTLRFNSDWFPIGGAGCGRLTVTKTNVGTTDLFAEGINSCDLSDPRLIARGIRAHY